MKKDAPCCNTLFLTGGRKRGKYKSKQKGKLRIIRIIRVGLKSKLSFGSIKVIIARQKDLSLEMEQAPIQVMLYTRVGYTHTHLGCYLSEFCNE